MRGARGTALSVGAGALVLGGALLGARLARAHGVGMSQLHLRVDGARVLGTWEVELTDARRALDLDPRETSGDAAWRQIADGQVALRRYVVGRVGLSMERGACPATDRAPSLEWRDGHARVLVPFAATCPGEPARLTVSCDLLFERDARHRAYLAIDDARVTHLGLFTADRRAITVDVRHFHPWSGFVELVREGAGHIWAGFDHVLFLLALLLPAPLSRRGGVWIPRARMAETLREVSKVVTAFTLAHSLTLGVSFYGLVTLPARAVEGVIALSVFAAAWNNLRPFLPGRAWMLALGFGLVHGLGFAGALRNLSLPMRARGLALAGFNVGVELGQLAIVAVVLPALHWLARRPSYPRVVMGAGSLLIAWLATAWFLERTFGLSFSFLGHGGP